MLKFFRALNISNKLAAVFMVLLFMMGVGGSVGLYNGTHIAKVAEHLYMDSFRRSETLSGIEKEFLFERQELFLYATTIDAASRSYLEGSMLEREKKITRLLDEYESFAVEGHDIELNELKNNLTKYRAIETSVLSLSASADREAAIALIRGEGSMRFIDTMDALKRLINEEAGTAYDAYKQIMSFARVIIAVTLILTIIAIVTAAGLWLILTRSIVRPILAIEDSAKKIAKGDLSERVPVMTEDELGSLAREFNRMTENLEDYYSTLEKKVRERTDDLERTNEEMSRKKREIERANEDLAQANRMKTQFLANMSHEFRTPLNSIIGFSELMQEKSVGGLNEKQAQYIEFIRTSGAELLDMLNNILELSRIEAGQFVISEDDFPLSEVLGEVLGVVRPEAHKRNIAITVKSAPASPVIRADRAKFKQVFYNLLSNAVKFNIDNGSVNIDWDITREPSGLRMKNFIVFRVTDTGIGIEEKEIERIFKEFEQLDSVSSREFGGTGLGLALTKKLVELLDGDIQVKSEPGKGSTFIVSLPHGTGRIDVPSAARVVKKDGRLPLVLVACESQDLNHLVAIYLTDANYEVVSVADGIELLSMARELKPFAIIMGVMLARKDGWEVLRELKSDGQTANIPAVILSSTDNREMAFSLGALEWLEKPVVRSSVLSALDRIEDKQKGQV
ncbi:MAG: MCP four helix bundle domain-containing protein [Deltaproteobacteria bacterium]|nr:MCP four helix bundle domain-containing protein [Deltaproteobacteria bacterium]